MIIVQETTEWKDAWVPNHVYVLNKSMSHMIAYVPAGSKTVKKFSKPIAFDRRGRSFVELETDSPSDPEPNVWTVEGSNGKTYYVTREAGGGMNYACTCPGFTFRGSCKHVAEFQANHSYDIR